MFHKNLPDPALTTTIEKFMFVTSREVASAIGALIHEATRCWLLQLHTGIEPMASCGNRTPAVDRPLPLWPYSASDNVNRARNSEPAKMAVNLNMQFVDIVVALCHGAGARRLLCGCGRTSPTARSTYVRSERYTGPAGSPGARSGETFVFVGPLPMSAITRVKGKRSPSVAPGAGRRATRVEHTP